MQVARRILAATAIAGIAFGFGAIGIGIPSPRSESLDAPATEALLRPSAGSSLERSIELLRARLRQRPDDARSLAALGLALVQEVKLTGETRSYVEAQEALERSLAVQPDGNVEAMIGLGALALARHEFAEALDWGRGVVAIDPYEGAGYGVVGDSLLELGRYGAAFRTFQQMVDVSPDIASYARASYARQLSGDRDGAREAMMLALRSAGTPDDAAWASHHLGELLIDGGRPVAAERAFRRAVFLAPSFLEARAGLAEVAWARGRPERAVRLLSGVVRTFPAPEFVVALGDLYTVTGRSALARAAYELARTEIARMRAGGMNVRLEVAEFEAEHGSPRRALVAARAEWAQRRSVEVADALAWALYANGRYERAAEASRSALRLGTRDPLSLYHAGMIELRLGEGAAARRLLSRALAIDPHFSILHAEEAARVLDRLGGS
jgi:tetratricopeptide (TPR) repeat protein